MLGRFFLDLCWVFQWSLPFEKTWTAGLGTNRSEIGPETRGSLGSNE